MNPVSLDLPEGASVYNILYPTRDPEYLAQDLLTVRLPSGYYIDVGWYPQHDPSGEYMIRVFFDSWENQQIDPITTKDLNHVISTVSDLCVGFARDIVPRRSSGSQLSEGREPRDVYTDDYCFLARSSTGMQALSFAGIE